MKVFIILSWIFASSLILATDYYTNTDNSFPEPEVNTEVYMGDRMLSQKYVYLEQCFNPKKSFTLLKAHEKALKREAVCLTSSKTIEKKSGSDGIRQITKGGKMCSTDIDEKYFSPKDFNSFRKIDGSEQHKDFTFLVYQRGNKVTIWQQPANAKMITMNVAEFEETFKRTEVFEEPWKTSLKFKKDVPMCKYKYHKETNEFYDVDAKIIKTLSDETLTKQVERVFVVPTVTGVEIIAKHGESSTIWNLSSEEFNSSFDETSREIQVATSLQRTIEYAGIDGDLVKFIYSEFKEGLARDAFTREFSIDLTKGNVAAFKGAVFEIIEATNATIKYKVIRNFPAS